MSSQRVLAQATATSAAAPLRRGTIHDGPLPADACSGARLTSSAHGAVASFLGVVRNHSRGAVLHYECYRPMAEKVFAQLLAEAAERFDRDLAADITHGVGPMTPGDIALAIHVASAHRAAAFDACRHLIERIKHDLPVWKRECYADGSGAWLKGS
jgi:molybdopterin synthase catalytic subunit